MTLEKLKDTARKYEQKQDWRRAIEAYLQAIDQFESGREPLPDLTLYNRVGDLYARVGDTGAAIRAYERASDLYADQGFLNNAIAVAGKIVRVAPGRTETLLRLAHLHARKGVMVEAKRHLLEYIERMNSVGNLDEAFQRVTDFADQFASNSDVRLMLSELLRASARTDAARTQLEKLEHGRAEAAAIAEESAASAEVVPLDARPEADTMPVRTTDLVFIDTGVFPIVSQAPEAEVESIRADYTTVDSGGVAPADGLIIEPLQDPLDELPADLTGFEPTEFGTGAAVVESGEVEGLLAPGFPREGTDEAEPLPGIVRDLGDAAAVVEETVAFVESAAISPADITIAPSDSDQLIGVASGVVEVPPLVPGEPPQPTIRELEDRILEDPSDPVAHLELGRALLVLGEEESGLQELALAQAGYEAREEWALALEVSDELLRRGGQNLAQLQQRVELAHRVSSRERRIEAGLALAMALRDQGEIAKAEAVYRQILELEPGHPEAEVALAELSPSQPVPEPPPPPAPPPPQASRPTAPAARPSVEAPHVADAPPIAPTRSYVDLGELVMGTEHRDPRMRVDRKEPTGEDEEKEFLEILQQFKRGIELNIGIEDFQVHYDLGIAYREMGLLDDAISEFQKALRDPDGRLRTAEALGLCFYDKGQPKVAEAVLRRAVEVVPGGDEQKIALLYWLGRSLEEQGRVEESLDWYERALAVDIRFMDLAGRIQRLTAGRRT